MNDRIKNAFDSIHAEEEIKNNTIKFINQKRRTKKSFSYKLVPMAAALLLVFGVCLFGYKLYSTPITVLSIDINPSLELGINYFDKVVEVKGYNEDGSELTTALDIKHSNYKDAIDKIMNYDEYTNEVVSITVGGKNGKNKNKILSNIEIISEKDENVYCESATDEEITDAHKKGLSFGKYKAYLKLLENGYEITEDEIKGMSMKDIKDKLKGHDKEENDSQSHDKNENNHGGNKNKTDSEDEKNEFGENGYHGEKN